MLLEFYQNLGFDINVVKNPEKYFAGELENDEGIKYLLNEPEDRANMFKASSGIKGGHLGGNWISRKQSMKDSVDFLQNNLI